jgi:hypothetical protein
MTHSNDSSAKVPPFGPVRKLRWLVGAAGKHELSRAELAMLVILADHTNTITGKAWPAFVRLAKLGGVTPRTAKRSVARLTALDLIAVAEHGGPGRSNRYRLHWDIFEQSEDSVDDDTIQTAMVTGTAANGDISDPKMVTQVSPNPINRSEHEAKEKIEGSQADCEAAPPRLGASDLPHKKGYERFWDAWGRKVTVSETERLIDAKVEEGHTLDEIVAGAHRFQKYCADTGKLARIKPAAFVHGEKWRDDWKLLRAEPKAEKCRTKGANSRRQKQKQPADKPKRQRNPWSYNPACFDWDAKFGKQIQIFLKSYSADFPNGRLSTDAEITRMQKLLEPWRAANPKPPEYQNRKTGETWGTSKDSFPDADWSPSMDRAVQSASEMKRS